MYVLTKKWECFKWIFGDGDDDEDIKFLPIYFLDLLE